MVNGVIITTPSELQTLIQDAVNVAVRNEFNLRQKLDPDISSHGEYLTIEQVASYTKLAKQTIYSYVSRREIPFLKKSKRLLFIKSDIDNWLIEEKRATKTNIIKRVYNDKIHSKTSSRAS
ncbi:MAG: helix-turn-helix domain-containing protein [Spirosomaceae bacterium]|jgi:excisionase family DNA binding protein|nr:helix-turn-helix domain-containing protein [Spirosomataceae bacterium]